MEKNIDMREEWRPAVYDGITYERFQVSNLGRVINLNYRGTGKAKLVEPFDNGHGYLQVNLCKNKEKKYCYVHRLVAEVFLPNPENKPFINHRIEGDKGKTINMVFFNEDRSIDKEKTTIEWVTAKENNNYETRNERIAKALSKRVLQLSLSGELIREWESTHECERNGFNHSSVCQCCNGKQKTHKGFRFMYYDDYKEKQLKELGCLPFW